MMKVSSIQEAWEKADEIFPTDYKKDEASSERAGYPIYRSTAEGHYHDYICDLGTRLEVNLSTGKTVNIWIEQSADEPEDVIEPTIKVTLIGKDGNVRNYGSYEEFIADWRFFMSGGKPMAIETRFNRMIEMLKELGDHEAAMETIDSGLIIKLIYVRWPDLKTREGFSTL